MTALWLAKNWRLLLTAAAIGLLGILLLLARVDARHWRSLADQEKAAHAQIVANYRAAADEAARLDAANVARAKAEQTAITERTIDAYQSQLADSASRYERLRAQASGYLRLPRPADMPDTRDATCRAVAGTGCEAIPPLLKAAQDNTDQLLALQAWTREQAGVDINGSRFGR